MHELDSLSAKQKGVLYATYHRAKQFDLGYTMSAIAWHESHFGLHPINLSDPSFGVFHNNIKSVCARHKCNRWSRSRLAERLLFDYDFAFSESLAELEYWKNYHTSKHHIFVWSLMVSSYNAGYHYDSKSAKRYLKTIKYRIKIIRHWFKKNHYN
jgi:hypothetical protein